MCKVCLCERFIHARLFGAVRCGSGCVSVAERALTGRTKEILRNRIEQVLFVLRCLLIAIERCMRALANPQPGRAHRSCTLTHTLMTVESS